VIPHRNPLEPATGKMEDGGDDLEDLRGPGNREAGVKKDRRTSDRNPWLATVAGEGTGWFTEETLQNRQRGCGEDIGGHPVLEESSRNLATGIGDGSRGWSTAKHRWNRQRG